MQANKALDSVIMQVQFRINSNAEPEKLWKRQPDFHHLEGDKAKNK